MFRNESPRRKKLAAVLLLLFAFIAYTGMDNQKKMNASLDRQQDAIINNVTGQQCDRFIRIERDDSAETVAAKQQDYTFSKNRGQNVCLIDKR